jgi:hypothetical protein
VTRDNSLGVKSSGENGRVVVALRRKRREQSPEQQARAE